MFANLSNLLLVIHTQYPAVALKRSFNQFTSSVSQSRRCLSVVARATFAFSILSMAMFVALAAGMSARVEGSVTDPSGAKIVAARVSLYDLAGVAVRQSRTDAEGRFSFNGVAEGRYTLMAEATGFAQTRKTIIDVKDGAAQPVVVDLRLEVAAISNQVVVTATRTESGLDELGGSVSVITDNQLERANHSLVSESLRLVPGLTVAQTGGRGGITSIFVRGGKSDYNKVLIDGVPVNAAGGLFDYASLTPENFRSIEVVRGPQSALFGSDAMTSVVQLFTKRGSSSTPELELSGEAGSFDFHRETARLSGVARWFDYSASFGFQSTDGRFSNSDFTNRSASTNLGFRISDRTDLRITSRLNNNSRGVAGPTSVLFADPDQRLKHRDIALGATLNWRTSARWHQSARYVYSEFETHSFDPVAQDLATPGTPVAPPGSFGTDFAFSFQDHQKRTGFQYQSIANVGSSSIITGGIDFERESAVFTDDFSRVSPSRNNLGVYVQDQTAIRDRLFITAGVRVERNSGKVPEDLRAVLASLGSGSPSGEAGFGVVANPKLGISIIARRHQEGARLGATRIKASFGTGIKEPRLDEAFSPSPFFIGNPSLDPEASVGYDFGASQDFFSRRASVDLTYFDNRFRDIILFTFDPATFGPILLDDGRLTNFINLERSSARGIELIGAARPVSQLRILASYTFLSSKIERAAQSISSEIGLPLIRRPRHSGTMEVSWVEERFDLSLEGSFIGKRRECDPVTCAKFDLSGRPFFIDGYAKLNGAGSYHINGAATVFIRAENLLNQDYEELLGYPAYRLNFSAGLRVRFGGNK
jgi:outer membrane cobalamin receptor